MAKLPAFQFYPGDWLKDPGVRGVSSGARGLWIDMLCVMSEASVRGHLQHANGKKITPEQLARMTGNDPSEVLTMLSELEQAGVYSVNGDGVITCRRMLRDEQFRQQRAEGGKQGAAHGVKGGRPKKPLANPSPEKERGTERGFANNPPSSSSSSSSSTSVNTPLPPKGDKPVRPKFDPLAEPLPWPSDAFRTAWGKWVEYRRERNLKLPKSTVQMQLQFLAEMPESKAIAAIGDSIRNSWNGLFEPKANGTNASASRPDVRQQILDAGNEFIRRGEAASGPN